MLKCGSPRLKQELVILFKKCLDQRQVPQAWLEAEVNLLHKKRDIRNLGNYGPISLLSQLYKLFTKINTKRLTGKIDFQQPREQAGFRSGFSTLDHIHASKHLIEKCNEYNLDLYIAFIDY
ncbi:hypothetical protein HHI36_019635 [Cryptolaemus montrouzieri]|uniref:Reverse transcriptase n=1 Tax=Cryptolaemus montrouzieri TaxID=559131 RepID=A0ABD2N815_9CUCU